MDYAAGLGVDAVELTSYFFPSTFDRAYLNEVKRRCHVNGLDISGGALIVNGSALTVSADGTSNAVDPAQSGSSGNALGGEARLLGTGGNITVAGTTLVRARGTTGAAGLGGVAGDATGGRALLSSQNGGTAALNGAVSVLANGLGGAGTAGGALGGNAFGGSASAGPFEGT